MTPVQSPPAPSQLQLQQQQQILGSIMARLAQLAKDPPDLIAYLRAHAECMTSILRPVGFAYDMQNGPAFQRLLHSNLETLGCKDSPEQEDAFRRARQMAFDQKKPVFLPSQTKESDRLHQLSAADSPAPDELAVFNYTPFEQIFLPIPLAETSAGVLQVWFQPGNSATSQGRLGVLRQLCNETESYLKNRRHREISHEVARLTTYARLLEELTGDIDLDSVSWKLVNYAREALACERVCLFIASDYDRAVQAQTSTGLEYKFQLQACSGLKRPHSKSEQAVVLQGVAQKLTEMSLNEIATEAPAPAGGNTAATHNPPIAAPESVNSKGERQIAGGPSRAPGDLGRPRIQLTLMMRDPSKTATRPSEVNDYFDLMPMNWATVIPLLDREHRVCGILLFEGVKLEETLANAIKPMIELAASAGKTLGTTLYCNQNQSMRVARRIIALRHEYVNTPAKRKWLRFGLPIFLFAAILACPVPYSVKGNANVLPVKQNTLPALVGARLLEVNVREGETVKKGQVLARFETTEIKLQLSQAEQEYDRSLIESDSALSQGNEAQMQMSRLNAEKADATARKLRHDLERAEIRAPFDGLVLGAQSLSTRVGEVLRIGEAALQVVDPAAWQVKASVKERDLIFLEKQLQQKGTVSAALRLSANPAEKYHLELVAANQLAYGLDASTGQYQFIAMLPLNGSIDKTSVLKAGFTGQVTFDAGMHSLAYFLFKDFADYLTIRFF